MDKLALAFTFLCLRAPTLRVEPRRLRAIGLLTVLFAGLNGCTTRPPESCSRQDIHLNWANPVALEQTVRVLSSAEFEGRKTQSQGAAKSRDYLNQQFKHLGLTPWGERFEIPFEYQTLFTRETGANMIAIAPAQSPTNEWRIIVAHYDHLGISGGKIYHGADDNASGVAAMLAIAQYWQA